MGFVLSESVGHDARTDSQSDARIKVLIDAMNKIQGTEKAAIKACHLLLIVTVAYLLLCNPCLP